MIKTILLIALILITACSEELNYNTPNFEFKENINTGFIYMENETIFILKGTPIIYINK